MSEPASPFADHLARGRDHFNTVLARAVALGADRDDVAAAVRELRPVVDPLAPALDEARLAALIEALVETTARCVAARRWRSDSAERWAVLALTPHVLPWLRSAPAVTVAALTDVARAVAARGDAAGWGRRVAAVASESDAPLPLDAGGIRDALLVAAWRSGLVRYRQAALRAAATLPAAVAAAALDLPPTTDVGDVLARHAEDPWWWPGHGAVDATDAPSVVGRFGGFRGFGGPWLTLPRVVGPLPGEPGLLWAVRTAEPHVEDWTLVCDAHGWAALRATPGDEERATSWGPASGPPDRTPPPGVPWLDDVTGQAATTTPSARLSLVSREHSYSLDLVRTPR